MAKIPFLLLILALTACSHSNYKPENKITVSYKAPIGTCENLGSDTVETKHWASQEADTLTDDVISDLVRSTCAKHANYIHIGRVENTWLKRGLSNELSKKEMKKTKVESTYYLCRFSN
ncbi:MAG: hypothetical protein ACOYL6_13215 [Bacteriovoracaceae bacterium]